MSEEGRRGNSFDGSQLEASSGEMTNAILKTPEKDADPHDMRLTTESDNDDGCGGDHIISTDSPRIEFPRVAEEDNEEEEEIRGDRVHFRELKHNDSSLESEKKAVSSDEQ